MVSKASALILAPVVVGAMLASVGAPETPTLTGAIEGTVSIEAAGRRRTANRYAGGSTRGAVIQEVPAVVYLAGAVPGEPPGAEATRVTMVQRDSTFVPGSVALQAGGSVEFPNDDPIFHNVFSYSPAQRFDLGRFSQGESKTVTFDTPGIVDVFCEVHEHMRGAIVVTENAFHAVVDESGSFRIDGVPAGEHTVVFWHPDAKATERTITVPEGGTARVEVELER